MAKLNIPIWDSEIVFITYQMEKIFLLKMNWIYLTYPVLSEGLTYAYTHETIITINVIKHSSPPKIPLCLLKVKIVYKVYNVML